MKTLLGIVLCLYVIDAFSAFCPSNFNQMNLGDSIEKVIQSCGQPKSQKTYIKEFENTISSPIGNAYGTTSFNQYGDTTTSYTTYTTPSYVSQRSIKRIEITELYYKEGTLIFEDGRLVKENKNYINFIPP